MEMTGIGKLVLVINCGSSSLKYALFPSGEREPLTSGLAECLGQGDARIVCKTVEEKLTFPLNGGGHAEALDTLLKLLGEKGWLQGIIAVGHRVVHGGEKFHSSALITDEMLELVESLSHLAPLHNPANILGIKTAMAKLPGVPQVAVFDTAFHQTMAEEAYLYALPMSLYRDYDIRRYGFHGSSHRYVSQEAVKLFNLDPDNYGMVIAHLGNGASATAIKNGKSVDTSMGLTPLEGLVMGTRSGDVDPGVLIYLLRDLGYNAATLDTMLNKKSGLLGLSELDNDMRAVQDAADSGHEGAKRAIRVFVHRLARYIAGLAASLDRLDMVVFTGGIGENSAMIRNLTLKHLGVFDIHLDEDANKGVYGGKSGLITKGGRVAAAVVPTNEEWMIATDTEEVVSGLK